ncbi:uncharacterized protein LOC122974010 [Thunnus albacares]|uniref:uncharacterized protein LOC122974010 n=1 Tax=Thunnus albacares TaxID=8236 RepID=UPI001CF66265|nr:uncharacterized protein LOC122974010 [Thunnus albacares]
MLFVKYTQMAGVHWMAVTLAVLLSAGNSLAAVDQNQLRRIVNEILNRFTPSYGNGRNFPMFSLAVSIPYNSDTKMYDISKVTDDGDQVRKTIVDCEVYTSERMVAATVLRWPNVLRQCPGGRVQWPDVLDKCPRTVKTWADVESWCSGAVKDKRADHAEYRTLQRFNTLVNRKDNKQDLLLFYVLASPCDKRCTSESSHFNILESINQILNWNNYAVVFSDVFKPRDGLIPEDDLRGSLERLGRYRGHLGSVGLNNIFRCNKQQCRSCSSNNEVARFCFSNHP